MVSDPRGFLAAVDCEAERERLRGLKVHGLLPFDPPDGQGSTKKRSRYTELSCQTFQRVNYFKAYSMPLYNDEYFKQRTISEFSNQVQLACYAGNAP